LLIECCAQRVLRHCNRLMLRHADASTLVVALQALRRSWQPGSALVDGSSRFTKVPAVEDMGCHDMITAGAGWHLTLDSVPLTRAALEALPQGLTHLELK
jgi:hypothetical protein